MLLLAIIQLKWNQITKRQCKGFISLWRQSFNEFRIGCQEFVSTYLPLSRFKPLKDPGCVFSFLISATASLAPITYKRYVDDSHCRFPSFDIADKFLDILNQEEPKVQFTIEYENDQKEMNFLDVTIKNTGEGNFIFKVYRKDAITNVQIQPSSAVPKSTKDVVFKGFLSRAYSICSPQYIQEEIDFLKNVFIENGYDEAHLNNITSSYVPPSQRQPITEVSEDEGNNELPLHASLHWVPGVSEKLRKEFKKANIKTTFKSTSNLKDILCSKNKSTLPPMPGVYMVSCSCGKKYVGEMFRDGKRQNSRRRGKKTLFRCISSGCWV